MSCKKSHKKLEELQSSVEKCRKEWISAVIKHSHKHINSLFIDTTTLLDDPEKYVIIYDQVSEAQQFRLYSKKIIKLHMAHAWRKHGVLNGLMWDSEKYSQVKLSFEELLKQVGKENHHLLIDCGYNGDCTCEDDEDEIVPRLPRYQNKRYPSRERSREGKIYCKILTIIIEGNCFLANGRVPLTEIIVSYAHNKHQDIEAWKFPSNPESEEVFLRNLRFL